MIDEGVIEVVTDRVMVFGGKSLPKGRYPGAVEWVRCNGANLMMRAIIRVDRGTLESLDEQIVPNLSQVDFDLLDYVQSGDIRCHVSLQQ